MIINIENIDMELFARDICNELNDDGLIKLITDIDLNVAEWGFTKKLYNYFKKEMEKCPN
jgi:hypothetical protein